jgi:FkbM family methyltransferase
MTRRVARRLLLLVPAPALRWLGRVQFRIPFLRRWGETVSRAILSGFVEIGHGPAKGLRIALGGAHPGYALGTSEPVLQAALVELLRPGDVFYDLGANVGFFTILGARLVGPKGHVVAFEPDPRNAATLRANVAANGFENVVVSERAVSEQPGTMRFVVGDSTTSHLLRENEAVADSTLVSVTSLDEFIGAGAPAPTMLKLDIEGEEVRALRGGAGLLRAGRPTVICEVHGTEAAVREMLGAAGYEVTVLESGEAWNPHLLARPHRLKGTCAS